jgi:hypothetical protein
MLDNKEDLPLDTRLLSDAIIELNISRHNVAIYPKNHPIVEKSLNRAFDILQKLFGLANRRIESGRLKTIKFLKVVENTDRKFLIDEDSKLDLLAAIMNKLEFSRPTCVIKYLKKIGASGDNLIANALVQIQ